MRYALILTLMALPAAADDRTSFYGTWGTEKQCARELIKPGGTVQAQPFVIDESWLKQGGLWCRLSWFPVEPRGDGYFTGAHAQCGEDAVRDYRLSMILSGEDLTLRWGFTLSNGPLQRCTAY